MKTERFEYLDSVRGIGAFIVLLTHLGIENFNQQLFATIPFHFFIAGSAAVCIFFIHSSFVLSYKYMGVENCKIKIIEAIIKRPFRLLGIILFSTFLVLINNRSIIFYGLDSFIYGTLLHPFTYGTKLNPPLWTINIELIGSFLLFGLVLLFGNIQKHIRMIIMIIFMFYFYNTFYCAFVFGIIIADLHKNWHIKWFIEHKNIISWILFIPALLMFSYPQKGLANEWFKSFINMEYGFIMIGSMLLFITVLMNNKIQSFLLYNRFQFLGKISYSMYAIHVPIMLFINGTIVRLFLSKYFETGILFTCLISIPSIIFLSWVITILIDKPSIKISALFSNKIIMLLNKKIILFKSMFNQA